VLLYAPFGLFFPAAPPKWRWRLLIATAVLLSSATEWTQVYSHTRFPSTTDVSCNVIGAVLGRLVADRRI